MKTLKKAVVEVLDVRRLTGPGDGDYFAFETSEGDFIVHGSTWPEGLVGQCLVEILYFGDAERVAACVKVLEGSDAPERALNGPYRARTVR